MNPNKTSFIVLFLFIQSISVFSDDFIDLREALKSKTPPIVLDVRTIEEYDSGHIPTAINIPISEITIDQVEDFATYFNTPIYVYCKSGKRSLKAVNQFKEWGYANIIDLETIDKWLYGTIGIDGWSIGNLDAKITVVEYIDLECPYSAMASRPQFELLNKYGDKIRLVFKHFPLSFHDNAKKAHSALIAAGNQGFFWDYRFSIAKYYNDLSDNNLIDIAQFLELDIERFKSDMSLSDDDEKLFLKDRTNGENVGVTGTPFYFVNGINTSNLDDAIETLLSGGEIKDEATIISEGCKEFNNE